MTFYKPDFCANFDVFMVTEAWMLKTDKGMDALGDRRVSEHPDRVEVLIVTHLKVKQKKIWDADVRDEAQC